jgi:radical SAM superfamily enzyme
LREAGLSRLHIGLESGYDPLLDYVEKGSTAAKSIAGGKNVVASGISLCEYVLLGLGGEKMWREHALDTAKALNQINPDFIRVRTLTVKRGMPLFDEVENGNFVRATDERIVEEERLLIENLTCHSNFVSDHITNLLQEVEGKLPEDKEKMLAVIDRFQSLPPEDRADFILGRRMGIYTSVDDLDDLHRREVVEKAKGRFNSEGNGIDDKVIYSLMERFI